MDVDEARKRVTVKAGTKINAVTRHLKALGLSLVNQGDIDSQAIAGALATGTHGTGTTLGNLSSQVVGMRIVRPDGSIMKVSDRQDLDLLHATQVNIGMFGVVSEITLQVTDAFWLHDRVWREDFDALMEQYDALAATHRHFGFFWCPTSASRDLLPARHHEGVEFEEGLRRVRDQGDGYHRRARSMKASTRRLPTAPRCTRSTTCRTSTSRVRGARPTRQGSTACAS